MLAVAVLALTFSVYAWFQASVVSKGNSITAGNYAIVVAVAANGREAGSPTRIDAESSFNGEIIRDLYGYLAKEWLCLHGLLQN